ncbi:LexA family protein [Pseudoroseomonas globiformis]|uniref:LexA family protein n=1 Tax=Teichococcus globiformis TaxID=2307229 RepID=A0ABV7G0I9_9PROT
MSDVVSLDELPHLTPRQREVLAWICRYWSSQRHAPTQREIAEGMGTSGHTAAPLVEPLLKKGYLQRTEAAVRNLRPTPRAFAKLEDPMS